MLTDKHESKVDETATSSLEDKEDTALLLEEATINGNTKALTNLIARSAKINSPFLTTSLLALTIRHKKPETLQRLLIFDYVITDVDIKEIKRLISDEFQKMSDPSKQDEDGLAILQTFKAHLKPRHFCGMPITFDFDAFLETINTVIVTLSPALPSAASIINSVVKPPLLHAFQTVDAVMLGTNTLFLLITNQAFDKFSDLLKLLITNAAFNINAVDNERKTLLHHASINVDDRFLKVLLENKADPNRGDKYSWTPVHWAAFTGKNFNVFMASSIAPSIPINWKAKTKKDETIFQLAVKGKKIPESDLIPIRLKCANTSESKNLSLH